MAKIIFFPDVYREQGHWLPAVTLAQNLQKQEQGGHEVAFMGIADCEAIIKPYGLEYHRIFTKEYPLGYTSSNQHRTVSERWKPVHLWHIMNGGLDKLMEELRPDLIVSGYFASIETLLMHYLYDNMKFMITTTYLRHPDDDPGIRALQNLFGMSEPMSRKIMSAVYKGPIDIDELTVYDFVKPLEAAYELVPCPREFEFDNYQFDSDLNENGRVKFIEPCVIRTMPPPPPGNITVDDWKAKIPADKLILDSETTKRKLIFATAGSQVQDYKDKARRWFQEMILLMNSQGMQGYHLVISMGTELIDEEWTLPKNVTIYSWVPQLEVLEYCTTAFIHGGLATIKECIYKNVPFIILPLGKDQMDNALRVRRNEVGQVAYAESSDFRELQNLFLRSQTNSWMKNRLKKMSKEFNVMENVTLPGAKLIKEYLSSFNG
ncbi:MAG: glycosyltransferase [Chitinispirillales bacterium]|jgi:UDP:flavonoid glycosyltransferase YjiC (YdhE family)|nr:glycosyltransferase [Chitinispirillales bacterium]